MSAGPADRAAALVLTVAGRLPQLGAVRLVCLDGPAGSGKTTLAAALAAADPTATVVHMDDLYDGWSALVGDRAAELTRRVAEDLLDPLAAGRPGAYRRYDWPGAAFAERHEVPPGGLLVLEGCASAQRAWAGRTAAAVWVEVPRPVRTARWLARDDDPRAARQCRDWQRDEDAWFAADGTRSRAEVVVDGGTGSARLSAGGQNPPSPEWSGPG